MNALMSDESHPLTKTDLLKMGLEGKDKAIAAYDEMLWKIRAGYVAVLYGGLMLVANLGGPEAWNVPLSSACLIAIILITGFTISGLALDYCFLNSKLRVIQTKELLVRLALRWASGETMEAIEGIPLDELLRNSGESDLKVVWKGRAPIWPIVLLYAATWLGACFAVWIMSFG